MFQIFTQAILKIRLDLKIMAVKTTDQTIACRNEERMRIKQAIGDFSMN